MPITYTAPATVPADPVVSIIATPAADTTAAIGSSITITIGTVKLAPAGLQFGTVLVGTASAPQTTTLTNTGNKTLSITGITIPAGPHQGDWSQTNTCGPNIATGQSCTITVIFKPTATGTRNTTISISDDSADSPQQVPLSGKGHSPTAEALRRSALTTYQTVAAPSPTGPSPVGTRVIDLVDSTRDDPFLTDGTKRELLVRFWYPASLSQACQPAQYTSPKIWSYFSKLVGVSLPKVATNSCSDATITDGAHPIVVFTPGYTATFTDYTFIFEDLASRGYIVASVAHTHETTAVEFPDGRFVESVLGSHLGKTLRGDVQALSFAVSVRLSDLEFVVNELEHLNARSDSPFSGKLDMSTIALAGHSMGGSAALLGVERDPRFRVGIIIDGDVPDALVSETQTPVLILAAGRERWNDNESRLWANLRGPRLAVNLRGTEHLTPSDAVWLAKGAIMTGAMGPDKTMAAVRNYIAAFLDANLRGKPWESLLIGPSSDFPDADVTTQNQLLRGEP
jgi:predicted dienelactone hydrolase